MSRFAYEPYRTMVTLPTGANEVSLYRISDLVRISGASDMDTFCAACAEDEDRLVNLARDCDPLDRMEVQGGDLAAAARNFATYYQSAFTVITPDALTAPKIGLFALADQLAACGRSVAVFPSLPGGRETPTLVTGPLDLTPVEISQAYQLPAPMYVANADAGAPVSLLIQAGQATRAFCANFGIKLLAADSQSLTVLPLGADEVMTTLFEPGQPQTAYLGAISKLLEKAGMQSVSYLADTNSLYDAMAQGDAQGLHDELRRVAPWFKSQYTVIEDTFGATPGVPSLEFNSGFTLHRADGDEPKWSPDTPWTLGRKSHCPGGRWEPPSDDWDEVREFSANEFGLATLREVFESAVKESLQNAFEGIALATDFQETEALAAEFRKSGKVSLGF